MLIYWFIGKILKFPISLLEINREYYGVVSLIILLIYIVEIVVSEIFFKNIKYYCLFKHS